MSSISKLEKNSNYLKVIWDDGEESKCNYLWLRDNCPSAHDKDSRLVFYLYSLLTLRIKT